MIVEQPFQPDAGELHAFLDLTPDAVIGVQAGAIVYVNQAFVRAMHASAPAALLGRPLLSIIAPEDRAMIQANLEDGDARAARAHTDVRVVREDGSGMIIQFAGLRFGDRSRPLGLFFCRDVTAERLRVEELRRADEERRLLFEGGAIGVAHTDTEGRFLHANRALCELLGHREEELRRLSELDLTHPDDRLLQVRALRKLWVGAAQVSLRKRFLRKGGEAVECAAHISLLHAADGRPRGYILHVLDNREGLRLEAARQLAEEQVRTMFENTPLAMGITSFTERRGYFQRVNPAACALLGYSEAEVLAQPMSQFVDPLDSTSNLSAMDPAQLRPGERYTTLKRYRSKGGGQVWAERYVSIVGGRPGQPEAAVIQLLDVTARVEAERALQQQQEVFRALMANLPNLTVLLFDLALRVTAVEGEQALRDLGLKPAEMLGRAVREVGQPENGAALEERLCAALRGERVRWEQERSGRSFECHLSPLRDALGAVSGGVLIAYDVTAVVRARAEALRAPREEPAMARFTTNV